MNCDSAGEFVSTLCDGERIPREAAEHLGACEECKAHLNDYVQMSVELKRMAIAAAPQSVREVSWEPQQRTKSSWWQMWRESMRIPRFAFGIMLVAIVSLAAGIAIVRANESERWFQFEVRTRQGATAEIGLMSAEPKEPVPSNAGTVIVNEPEGTLAFIVRVLAGSGGSEKLGVRTLWLPKDVSQSGIEEKVLAAPEKEFWVIPGQKLSVPVKDYGQIEITGRLLDKLPDDRNPKEMRLYPKEGEFRLTSPQVLLLDGRVVSKGGGDGSNYTEGSYFAYYAPHDGFYIFAFREFPGATEGSVESNQVDFTLEGKAYSLIAAAPIVEPSIKKIWIRHHAGSRLTDVQPDFPDQDSHSSMTFGNLKAMLEHITKE
jgi:hypothetical protein